MQPDIDRIAQLLVMVAAFATFVVTLTIVTRFAFSRIRGRPSPEPTESPRIDDSRFARLEEAVDSIAIEVERIAESQRFTAKLMSERVPQRLPEQAPERAKLP
jgi:hypothetical protein